MLPFLCKSKIKLASVYQHLMTIISLKKGDTMNLKVKHLEMIQVIISRMANSSFLLKGWSVVLVSALFALAAKDAEISFIFTAYFPALAFWILDGYFLGQERLFRKLYDQIRLTEEDKIDFSMDRSSITKKYEWLKAIFSKTLFIFHGAILGTIIIIVWLM